MLPGKGKGCNRNAAKLARKQSSVAKREQRNGRAEMRGNIIITVNTFRKKILKVEDCYCLQILEMQILTMRKEFFFLIEKNVYRENEVGK